MNTTPVMTLHGTVHGRRPVTWEAGVNKSGRPYDAGSYTELLIVTDRSVLAGELTEVPATAAVRCDDAEAVAYGDGEVVSLPVTCFAGLAGRPGKWFNVVEYRLARPAVASASHNGASGSARGYAAG